MSQAVQEARRLQEEDLQGGDPQLKRLVLADPVVPEGLAVLEAEPGLRVEDHADVVAVAHERGGGAPHLAAAPVHGAHLADERGGPAVVLADQLWRVGILHQVHHVRRQMYDTRDDLCRLWNTHEEL